MVYEALDLHRNTRVAMKTLLRADGDALLRFKREFRAFQDLEHPNLVRLYELVENEGEWFITMELVDGEDVLDYVLDDDGLDEDRLRSVLGQLSLGIAALHGAGKVHRDIKPSNALVTRDGRVVILDLGLVVDQRGSTISIDNSLVGTPSYMAPEQVIGHTMPESDWYALGAILYQALTGRLPFDGSPFDILMQKQEREPPAPKEVVDDVPDDLNELCVDLLRLNPAKRPPERDILARLGVRKSTDPAAVSMTYAPHAFVGRQQELAEIGEAYRDVAAGDSVTVIVHGASGVGKSALVREFVATTTALTDEPPLVLAGRCYENESLSYNAFDGVVDALSAYLRKLTEAEAGELLDHPDIGLLVRAFPVLAQVEALAATPLWHGDVRDPDELKSRLLAALRALFRRIGDRTNCVVSIDDLQWANRDSLLLLGELMRAPRPPRLLLLVTSRPDPDRGGRPDYGLPGDVRDVELAALRDADAVSLARTLLASVGLPVSGADAIAHEAEGHPLHIDALIRHAVQGGDVTDKPQLDQALLVRAATLGPEARRILELICLAGAPTSRDIIARAAAVDADTFSRCFGALRLHNLARSASGRADAVMPYHDRVREAVDGGLGADERHEYHGRLAIALETAGAEPEVLVRHLVASDQTERAAVKAMRAAEATSGALAFDRSAELYQLALHLGVPGAEERRAVRARLSDALASAGRGAEAAKSYLLAAEGADKATRLECYRRAAEQWLMTGHIDDGLATLRELLHENHARYPSTPRRALLSLVTSRLTLALRGLRWKPRDESELGREYLTRVDMFTSVGQGMGLVDSIRGASFQSRGLLLALRAGEPSRVARALSLEAIFQASQGIRSIAKSRALLERTRALAKDDAYLETWLMTADGITKYFEGLFGEAAETLQQALVVWRQHPAGNMWEKNNTAVFRLLALRLRGDAAQLGKLSSELLLYARRRGNRFLETTVLRSSNLTWLCADEPGVARSNLEAARWVPPEGRFHLQHWYEVEAASELGLYQGRGLEALRLAGPRLDELRRSLLTRVETVRVLSRWLSGRLHLAAAREEPEALRGATRAARALAREKVAYARDFANLLRGGIAELDGDDAAAAARFAAVTDSQMALPAALARRWLALRSRDDGALQEASEALTRLGVVRPDRVARLFCLSR